MLPSKVIWSTVADPETDNVPLIVVLSNVVEPSTFRPSSCVVPSTSRLPATFKLAPASRLPVTTKLSSTVVVPPAESSVKLPDAVSISPLPLTPTLISSMCASENGNDAVPRYAPSSVSGRIPVSTVTSPVNLEVPATVKLL